MHLVKKNQLIIYKVKRGLVFTPLHLAKTRYQNLRHRKGVFNFECEEVREVTVFHKILRQIEWLFKLSICAFTHHFMIVVG